jgi:hypothetical protein
MSISVLFLNYWLVLFAQPHACAVLVAAVIAGKWEWRLSRDSGIMWGMPAFFDTDERISILLHNIYNRVSTFSVEDEI